MDTRERVKNILIEQLGVDEDAVTDEVRLQPPAGEPHIDGGQPGRDLGADSLDVVELIMTVEEEFRIEIADDEADKVSTVRDVVELVDRKVSATA